MSQKICIEKLSYNVLSISVTEILCVKIVFDCTRAFNNAYRYFNIEKITILHILNNTIYK